VFYLKYDMYRNAWPLLALATYRNLLRGVKPGFIDAPANGQSHYLRETMAGRQA